MLALLLAFTCGAEGWRKPNSFFTKPMTENDRGRKKSGSSPSLSADATRSAMVRPSSSSYCVFMNSRSPPSTGVMLPASTIFATLRSICSRTPDVYSGVCISVDSAA